MMDKEIFKIWAPTNAKWVDWVRPVPFIGITEEQTKHAFNFQLPTIDYIDEKRIDTAYIVDLPNYESIIEGISLAKLGYRPIPLYNGTNQQTDSMSLVDNRGIQNALIWGTVQLRETEINNDALPVFLLDSNRVHRFKSNVSVYDNSWDIYDQDIPSPEYFIKNGISRVVVRGDKIQRDLARILYNFQKKGISIFFTNGLEIPKEVRIKKPPRKDKLH